MDCISSNSVYISCKEKAFFIPINEATPEDVMIVLIEGIVNMINCLFTQEKAFILVITMDSKDKPNVSEILVVCKFLDVFPKDVNSLPLKREVEFSIDLVPRTTLVFHSVTT